MIGRRLSRFASTKIGLEAPWKQPPRRYSAALKYATRRSVAQSSARATQRAFTHRPAPVNNPRRFLPPWSIEGGRHTDSTLAAAVPIKRPCRCVSVPTPGWGLSSRVCLRLPRRRLPGMAGCTKSSMTAFASWPGAALARQKKIGVDELRPAVLTDGYRTGRYLLPTDKDRLGNSL